MVGRSDEHRGLRQDRVGFIGEGVERRRPLRREIISDFGTILLAPQDQSQLMDVGDLAPHDRTPEPRPVEAGIAQAERLTRQVARGVDHLPP